MSPLLDGVGDLVVADTDEAEALRTFLAPVLPTRWPGPLCIGKGLKEKKIYEQCHPLSAQGLLVKPWSIQVHGSKGAGRAGWCPCKAALSSLRVVIRGAPLQLERQVLYPYPSSRKAERATQGTASGKMR